MRKNKWSATVALITVLLSGGSLATDSNKSRGEKATDSKACCERTSGGWVPEKATTRVP